MNSHIGREVFTQPGAMGVVAYRGRVEIGTTGTIKEALRRKTKVNQYVARGSGRYQLTLVGTNKAKVEPSVTWSSCFIDRNRLQEFSLLGSKDTGSVEGDVVASLFGLEELQDVISRFVRPESFVLKGYMRADRTDELAVLERNRSDLGVQRRALIGDLKMCVAKVCELLGLRTDQDYCVRSRTLRLPRLIESRIRKAERLGHGPGSSNIMATGSYLLGAMVYDFASNHQMLTTIEPWRMTLLMVSAPGIFMSLVIMVTLNEPPRIFDDGDAHGDEMVDVVRFLRTNRATFIPFFIAVGLMATLTLAVMSWGPVILVRMHGVSTAQASYLLGMLGMPASLLGTFLLPLLVSRLHMQGRSDAIIWVLMLCVAVPIPTLTYGMLSGEYWALVLALTLAMLFMPSVTAITCLGMQFVSPSRMRARNVALNLLVINLFGYTAGPLLSGLLADRVFEGPSAVAFSIAVLSLTLGPLSLLSFWVARVPFGALVNVR